MTPANPIAIAASVATILDRLKIRYVIDGSVASSMYGEPRSTLDLDLMVDADEAQVRSLVGALREDFYVDATAAIRNAQSHIDD